MYTDGSKILKINITIELHKLGNDDSYFRLYGIPYYLAHNN